MQKEKRDQLIVNKSYKKSNELINAMGKGTALSQKLFAIGMQHISDGTLRYLLLMGILLNKHRGAIVGLDEPEGRLHPDMINSVAEMLRRASNSSQLIIATHSPLLLNAFTLEDVLVFEKEENNASVVKRYYEEDFDMYEGDLLPGQLWLRGEIGGKRW